jgi:hypothetical protein
MQNPQGYQLVHVQLGLASPIKTGFTPDPYAILPHNHDPSHSHLKRTNNHPPFQTVSL